MIKKKSMLKLATAFVAASMIAACAEKKPETEKFEFSPERIKADMAFLADDTLGGRNSGSEGHKIATNFMATSYTHMGVKPAGVDGTYFQPVTLVKSKVNLESLKVSTDIDGEKTGLVMGVDYAVITDGLPKSADFTGEMVFVGFGLEEDYKGKDLKGKVAVALYNTPKSMRSDVNAHYRRSSDRQEIAKANGAVGLLMVENHARRGSLSNRNYGFYFARERMHWINAETGEGRDRSNEVPYVMLTHKAANKIFKASGHNLLNILDTALESEILDAIDLKGTASVSYTVDHEAPIISRNVVAKIEGSDPKLKDEYIVLTAHIDHVGVYENLAKSTTDHIHNGAMDNASGTATLLEVARAIMASKTKPKRSILFVSVTAEEKGLIGADYFARFPTVPKGQMVANVNLDMPILTYDFADVVAFGSEHSSFKEVMDKVGEISGVTASPDPIPEQVLFVRSDHYRFVQQGIPSIFLMTGHGMTKDGVNGGEMFMKFLRGNYHSPMDDMSQDIDFNAAAKFAYINYLIATEVANAPEKPKWKDWSFFGKKSKK